MRLRQVILASGGALLLAAPAFAQADGPPPGAPPMPPPMAQPAEPAAAARAAEEAALLAELAAPQDPKRVPRTVHQLQRLADDTNRLAATRARACELAATALAGVTNYAGALNLLTRAQELEPAPERRLEMQAFQARLLLRSGQVDRGTELLRAAAAGAGSPDRAARLQLELADTLAQISEWTEAAAEYQAWLEAFDGAAGTAEARAGLGWALWTLGRQEEAAPQFARAAAAESDPARRLELQFKEADALFAARRFDSAAGRYAAVLAAAPADAELADRARYQLAETELARGQTEAGETRLLELSRTQPGTVFAREAVLRLGSLYEERGALETAIEQYGRLSDAGDDPERCARALLARGLVRYRLGAFQEALDDFDRIRDTLPRTPPAAQAMFMRGWCLYMLGRNAEALQACEQFLEGRPRSEFVPDARFWLAEQAFQRGEYADAEARFTRLADEHPRSPRAGDALFQAGRAATARHAPLAANEHYNALLARVPDHPRIAAALLAQGDVLAELGQFAAAILAFNEVIVKFPQQPEALAAWGRKGDCQYTLGAENPARYEEALLSYRTLLDFAGAPADLRLQAGFKLGRCQEKMGRAPAALDRYLEVLAAYAQERKPAETATVWFMRAAFAAAALQEAAGNWREAAGTYRRVIAAGAPAAGAARAHLERLRRDRGAGF